jgi:nucleoside-diphosphate-sugar epimerase
MSGADRNAVLIGHSGFLGVALTAAIRAKGGGYAQLIAEPRRDFVKDVLDGNGRELIASLLAGGGPQDWICTVGVVDPRADPDLMEAVNVEFPRRLYGLLGSLAPAGTARFVTFGSVLEGHRELATSNPYLASKSRMFDTLCGAGGAVRWHHIRMHTLYGGSKRPHPFMFAGQMYDALARKEPFKMSGGAQLREYHHVEDIAASTLAFLAGPYDDGMVELSSGNPIRLRDLASAVFKHFDASDLLEIGAKVHSNAEVFENTYQRSSHLIASREPVDGLIAWFEELRVARS